MKRAIVIILSFVVIIFILFQYKEQEAKETFNINAETEEEITNELIIAFLMQNIRSDIKRFYSKYYSGDVSVYDYETSVLGVEKDNTNSIIVKIGTTPQVGAHNPVGYDELHYAVDVNGNITLKNYEHFKKRIANQDYSLKIH